VNICENLRLNYFVACCKSKKDKLNVTRILNWKLRSDNTQNFGDPPPSV